MAIHGTVRAVEVRVTSPLPVPFDNIKCTTCGALIPITEALQHQLSEQAESKVREAVARREQDLAAKESTIVEREQSVAIAEANIDARVQARLTSERSHIEETIRAAARADVDSEISELRAHASAVDEGLKKAQQSSRKRRAMYAWAATSFAEALAADVLKVAHRGSETANTQAFIDRVNPIFAIISASAKHECRAIRL
jgi:hypothetical protein